MNSELDICESDYTDDEIKALIRCGKKVIAPPRESMRQKENTLRNEMTVQSIEDDGCFHIFMRKHVDYDENFSIGLEFLPGDGRQRVRLIRFNGPHEPPTSWESPSQSWHDGCHVHTANATNISAGFRADRTGVKTDLYRSYEEALGAFFREINLVDFREHFPTLGQRTLQFGKEGH